MQGVSVTIQNLAMEDLYKDSLLRPARGKFGLLGTVEA